MKIKVETEREINIMNVADSAYDILFDTIDDYLDDHYSISLHDLSEKSYREFSENLMKVLTEKFEGER